METYIDRLRQERDDLKEKMDKIESLTDKQKNRIPLVQLSFINIQYAAMETYCRCLSERINWMMLGNGDYFKNP
jgi:hypothetical protein